MKLAIYALRDGKTASFGNSMCLTNDGHAIRSVSDEVNNGRDGNNMLNKHPEDFELFHLGFFETDSGLYDTGTPRSVVQCSELVRK